MALVKVRTLFLIAATPVHLSPVLSVIFISFPPRCNFPGRGIIIQIFIEKNTSHTNNNILSRNQSVCDSDPTDLPTCPLILSVFDHIALFLFYNNFSHRSIFIIKLVSDHYKPLTFKHFFNYIPTHNCMKLFLLETFEP